MSLPPSSKGVLDHGCASEQHSHVSSVFQLRGKMPAKSKTEFGLARTSHSPANGFRVACGSTIVALASALPMLLGARDMVLGCSAGA